MGERLLMLAPFLNDETHDPAILRAADGINRSRPCRRSLPILSLPMAAHNMRLSRSPWKNMKRSMAG